LPDPTTAGTCAQLKAHGDTQKPGLVPGFLLRVIPSRDLLIALKFHEILTFGCTHR
jgi:hypothetical protein